jgi:hypothetical protein
LAVAPSSGGSAVETSIVIGTLELADLTVQSPSISVHTLQQVTLTLTHTPSSDIEVTFHSSDPEVAPDLTSILFPAGTSTRTFGVVGLSPGHVTLTASLNASSKSVEYDVTP